MDVNSFFRSLFAHLSMDGRISYIGIARLYLRGFIDTYGECVMRLPYIDTEGTLHVYYEHAPLCFNTLFREVDRAKRSMTPIAPTHISGDTVGGVPVSALPIQVWGTWFQAKNFIMNKDDLNWYEFVHLNLHLLDEMLKCGKTLSLRIIVHANDGAYGYSKDDMERLEPAWQMALSKIRQAGAELHLCNGEEEWSALLGFVWA